VESSAGRRRAARSRHGTHRRTSARIATVIGRRCARGTLSPRRSEPRVLLTDSSDPHSADRAKLWNQQIRCPEEDRAVLRKSTRLVGKPPRSRACRRSTPPRLRQIYFRRESPPNNRHMIELTTSERFTGRLRQHCSIEHRLCSRRRDFRRFSAKILDWMVERSGFEPSTLTLRT
jgi:hypothetical protein